MHAKNLISKLRTKEKSVLHLFKVGVTSPQDTTVTEPSHYSGMLQGP